ncbi:MAG: RidA family protein [Chloroflexi bacterium]|nr:RidA family protein [Chloroflexota bacterium]MCL5026430.1 RidA family protein [Chloroflexota bacterium]
MPKKQVVAPAGMAASSAPLSPAIRFGNLIFISGQVGRNPATGKMEGTIQEQARHTMDSVKAIVEAAGCAMDDILKTTCYLSDINNREPFNAVYATYFGAERPARSCFAVGALGPGCLVEVEAIVGVPD